MSNVVRLPQIPLRQAIRAFRTSGSLADLTAVISLCLQSEFEDDSLAASIPTRLSKVDHRARISFYECLAKVTAVIPQQDRPPLSSGNAFEKAYCSEKERYSAFVPAWEIADLLPKIFPDIDPGRVIGRHIELLFNRETLQDPELHVWFEPTEAGYASAVKLCIPVLEALIRETETSVEERAACRLVLQTLQRSGAEVPFSDVAPTLVMAPALRQPLFTTVLNVLCFGGVDFEPKGDLLRAMAHMALTALFSCTEVGRSAATERYETSIAFARAMSDELKREEKIAQRQERQTGVAAARALYEAWAKALSARKTQAYELRGVVPTQLLARLFEVNGVYEWATQRYKGLGDGLKVLAPHFEAIGQYRSARGDGSAPWEIRKSYLMADVADWLTPIGGDRLKDDLALCLSGLWESGRDPSGELTYLPLWVGDSSRSTTRAIAHRCREYQRLYKAALADGLNEMACAIQSFFLCSQAIRYAGTLGAWSEYGANLREALELDRLSMVKTSISYASVVARKHGKRLVASRLQSVSAQESRFSSTTIEPVGFETGRDAIYGYLVRQLEERRLNKLCDEARRFLMDAHLKFAVLRGKTAQGDIGHWGDVGNNIRKAFEAELNDRLLLIYRSPAYAAFQKQRDPTQPVKRGRPSLVHFLYLLQGYSALDQKLRSLVDSRVDVLRDVDLVPELLKLDADYLSEGSHANPFPLDKAQELTGRLYEGGIMNRFLDILV